MKATEPASAVRLAETFLSLQGEGPSLGEPAHFIRLQGCSVGCHWCDSKYTWDEERGEKTSLPALWTSLQELGHADLVVITGGEPLENPVLPELIAWASSRWCRVEIETSGNRPLPEVAQNVTWNWSPKLSSVTPSHEATWRHHEDFQGSGSYVCKVVVDTEPDWSELCDRVRRLAIPRERVVVMPQGMTTEQIVERARWLAPLVIERGFRLTTRLHVAIWGARRGV